MDDNDKEIIKYEVGASTKLGIIKDRLNLLEYSLDEIKKKYYDNIKELRKIKTKGPKDCSD